MSKADKMQSKCLQVSTLLKALAHPQRLMILCYLAEEEKCVSDLLELCDISQSQLSQFLVRMQREGLLSVRKDAQFSYYSIKDQEVLKLIKAMQNIF